MVDLYIPNTLRRIVEHVSDGAQTLHFTNKGQPSLFNVFSFDYIASVGNANLANGCIPNNASELHIATYLSSYSDGELVSRPWGDPARHFTIKKFAQLAAQTAPEMQLLTGSQMQFMYSMTKNATVQQAGNIHYGEDYLGNSGVRVDGKNPGVESGEGVTYTGSGPLSWRLNGEPTGLCDVNGNLMEYLHDVMFLGDALLLARYGHTEHGDQMMLEPTNLFYVEQDGSSVKASSVPNSPSTSDLLNAYRITNSGSVFADSFQSTGTYYSVERLNMATFSDSDLMYVGGFELPQPPNDYDAGHIDQARIQVNLGVSRTTAVAVSSSYDNPGRDRHHCLFDMAATRDRNANNVAAPNIGARLSLTV